MTTTVPALDAASLPALCAVCVQHQGLCAAHAKHVLPQLAQPHWYQLIGTPLEADRVVKEETPAVIRAKRRNARRLERAMRGEFTRSTKAA